VAVDVKVCGLTRAGDAEAAVRAGVRFLGVVRDAGPRVASGSEVREVVSAAGGAPVLGVYTRTPAAAILRERDGLGLAGAQLHGPYEDETARRLGEEGLLVWRVLRIAGSDDLEAVGAGPDGDAVLVEPRVPSLSGGTGVSVDLDLARSARMRLRSRIMVLAGGLTVASVGRAIAVVQPDAVDVSSGVELRPGIKDP
jgi:phosphoribosylanthranilate isomerase